ncbi:hypothetical protein DCC79_14660 [bacterium]|nr:DUF2470 domain-containing protein [Chloroflexi bacterium CFX6]RIL07637.1 MAG: hypothetical protein DCC79_14660 [bacterium]
MVTDPTPAGATADATVSPDPIAAIAADVIAHMNDDHADTLRLYARVYAGLPAEAAEMTSVDGLGFGLRVRAADGVHDVRLAFPAPVHDGDEVRAALVAMARGARG